VFYVYVKTLTYLKYVQGSPDGLALYSRDLPQGGVEIPGIDGSNGQKEDIAKLK